MTASDGLSQDTPVELTVADEVAGIRVDQYLAQQFPDYSRVHLRKVIDAGGVQVNGKQIKPSFKLSAGEQVTILLPEIPRQGPKPEAIPLEILYEDEWMAAVNKPPGMVVHPAKGNWSGTLTSALQYHFDQLSSAGGPTRPGVVHRLDRDTSGVLVVAKTDRALFALCEQFEKRTVAKEYFAIVLGTPDRDADRIHLPIGIHPYQRERMAIRRDHPSSREAETTYEVMQRYDGFSTVRVLPKTGRTHQIRVHLSHVGYPILCDRLYGGRAAITLGEFKRQPADETMLLQRQALHAHRLHIRHPESGELLSFEAPLPADLTGVIDCLNQYRLPK